MTYHRYLEHIITETCFPADKMAFVSGPRQCGKTTMAKLLLKQRGKGTYYNWDETKFRRIWTKDPLLILPPVTSANTKPLIVLDELHKAKLWKRSLKGLYDTQDGLCDILVTGSGRLNVYRKGSDSLMGRYYHYKLHPFSLSELLKNRYFVDPDNLISILFSGVTERSKLFEESFENLYEFGPFPEPLFAASNKILNLWRRNRIEKIIREDLRDLSRLPELSQVEMLASLLPERVAQPLSIRSLSEDLEVAYTTVKRWLNYLNELYYLFLIKPYSRSLPRAIKKENKLYLWDWSEIEIPGARFENMIAAHLLKYCDFLTDSGYGDFELRYLRNKEKFELDFIIIKNKKPFLVLEAKLSDEQPSSSWFKLMRNVNCTYGVQLVKKSNVYKIQELDGQKILIISAADFLKYLV